jgi:hypothetical protein
MKSNACDTANSNGHAAIDEVLAETEKVSRKRPLEQEEEEKDLKEEEELVENVNKKSKKAEDADVSKVVVDLVKKVEETTAESSPAKKCSKEQVVKAENNGSGASARAFREESLSRILRQNLNKAVNKADCPDSADTAIKTYDELKKKMKIVMLSAIVKSKSETGEAGHDLFECDDFSEAEGSASAEESSSEDQEQQNDNASEENDGC